MASTSSRVDFFVSYNGADRQWAEWIAWHAESAGYSTVIQAWDFKPGANFVAEMQDGLTRAKKIIAVLSPHYLQSDFCLTEWASAFARDPRGKARSLIPVRVQACQPDGLLGQIVYIDLVDKTQELAKEKLLEGLTAYTDSISDRLKPSSPPKFPAQTKVQTEPVFPPHSINLHAGDVFEVKLGDGNRDVLIGKNNIKTMRKL